MMDVMTKEDSYADRRLLFKNIWEAAMQIDEKDVENIMVKPKVIKTLRLDEVDKFSIGKRKKERIRNLRTVCKKILAFCDLQDADDMIYEQNAKKKEGDECDECDEQLEHKSDVKPKKVKKYHRRKKFKRATSLFVPKKSSGHRATTSERKDDYPRAFVNSPRNKSPMKIKRPTSHFVQRTSVIHKRALKANSNPDTEVSNSPAKGSITRRRRVVRKKRSKPKKSTAPHLSAPGTSGIRLARPTRM